MGNILLFTSRFGYWTSLNLHFVVITMFAKSYIRSLPHINCYLSRMPIQATQWTDYLNCPMCTREFAPPVRCPVSLGCGHTLCRDCLRTVLNKPCPFDQVSPLILCNCYNVSNISTSSKCNSVYVTFFLFFVC